jgi:transcriptional regulator with XRE-family HTH domain
MNLDREVVSSAPMQGNQPSLHRLAELLKSRLAEVGVSLPEVERRLAWRDGTLSQILGGGAELKVKDLLEILKAAGIEERSFFAALYDLEPRCRSVSEQGEIPYSIGHLSEEDAPAFPPLREVLSLFNEMVTQGVRRESENRQELRFLDEADLLDPPIPED